MIRFLLSIAILITFILGTFAYVLLGPMWPIGTVVGFYINPNTGQVDDETDAVNRAANSWSQIQPAGLQLSNQGSTSLDTDDYDGMNVIFWRNDGSTEYIAYARFWYFTSNNTNQWLGLSLGKRTRLDQHDSDHPLEYLSFLWG